MAIETSGYHNQNAVIAKVQSALEAMLVDLNITGWQVLRSNQPTIQALQNKSVYYDIISKRRVGTQGVKSVKNNTSWQEVGVCYDECVV